MWGSQGWNQWALQPPAMFNDVPHEQIDWAELAKQWIQMQQTQPADVPTPLPPPPPPPSSQSLPPPPGHMPPMPEEFVEIPAPSLGKAPLPPPAIIPEPFHQERPFVENETVSFIPKTATDNSFWSKSQWEASASEDVDERMWPTPTVEPTVSIIGGKETFDYGHMHDNPPLAMQSIDYNHMSEFSYNQIYPAPAPVPESHYDQYWSQVNATPAISPIFLKKERSTASLPVDEVSSHLDAAKRKQLPAWIRDGLEKMEQERLKRLEKERNAKEKAETLAKSGSLKKDINSEDPSPMALPAKSKFDSESEAEDEVEDPPKIKQNSPVEKPPLSPVEDLRTEEEKKQDLMLNVRRILTEVLLTVTNSEMVSIAQEVFKKVLSKAPARQLASTTSLTSVASGLRGLASYGTESEASEVEEDQEKSDSEEELYRKIREKKKLFAVKERKIIADLERKEKLEAEKVNNEKNEKKMMKDSVPAEKLNDALNDLHNADKQLPNALEQSGQPMVEVVTSEVQRPENMNNSSTDEKQPQNVDLQADNPPKLTPKEESDSSDSSSSSDSDSESGDAHKNKSHKETKSSKSVSKKSTKKEKNSIKRERRKRSKSRDSDSSGKYKRDRSRDRGDRKSKKRKKYKSESSSSSSNESRKKNHSSKYESSHNHRSRSYDRERKRRRSISPYRSHHKSDSHAYSSRSRRYEDEKYHRKHRDEKKYRESRHSPSPKHSSRLPRKYRSSRSLSSESGSSGKKLKKSRNR